MKSLRLMIALLALSLSQALGAPSIARAEPGGLHLNLTPFGGYGVWAKDVNLANKATFGGRVGLGFGRHLGVEGYYGWMHTRTEYGSGDSLFTANSLTPPTDQSIKLYGADLTLNLLPSIAFNPYVFAGWHEEKIESDVSSIRNFMNGPEFGGGVKLGVGRKTALRFEIRDKVWKYDSPPVPDPPGDKSIHNLFYTGGIQITLGGSGHDGDLDKDGVKDSKDTCPGTPDGALVDANGCPIDSDHDGVADGIDQCPNTVSGATVDARGCPSDSDGDGVADGIDQCQGTPAGTKVDARGCPPDSDGDRVTDDLDKCPNTPAGTQVDADGCPIAVDSDHDGVTDDKDRCPNTRADVKVDADGCPITLTERETELLDKGRITTREIHFETAKWDILPESTPILDDIGSILIQWPQLRIEVGGHCDARGSDAYNLDLSQKRAQSVLDYMLQKFPQIERAQYAAKGYGERVPVASNKTVEGMAKNRRVEFKVLNTEELTKERERRRLLKTGE
jgi:outer membrane protein OmpA-like peptidoglycan-associated protein